MSDLLDVKINAEKRQDIVGKLGRNPKLINNRRIIQETAELLKNIEFTSEQTVDEILEENASLKLLYLSLIHI